MSGSRSYKNTMEFAVALFAIGSAFAANYAKTKKLPSAAIATGMDLLKNGALQLTIKEAVDGATEIVSEVRDTQADEVFAVGSLALAEGHKIFKLIKDA